MSFDLVPTGGGSVLPQVPCAQGPNGVHLVSRPGEGKTGALVFLGVGGIFTFIGAVMWVSLLVTGDWVNFGFLLMLIGLIGAVYAGRRFYHAASEYEAQLEVGELPLRLGDTRTIRFRQGRRGKAYITSIAATLTGEEWVRYDAGSSSATRTHTFYQQPLPPHADDPLGNSEVLRGTWTLHIPVDQPPSFAASDNALRWRVDVHAVIARRPDIRTSFQLPVLPEVVRDLR